MVRCGPGGATPPVIPARTRAWWKRAFAGALGVRLGGPTQYRHELEIRPTLGDGRVPSVEDLRRSVRLSRLVQTAAAGVAVGAQRRRP